MINLIVQELENRISELEEQNLKNVAHLTLLQKFINENFETIDSIHDRLDSLEKTTYNCKN